MAEGVPVTPRAIESLLLAFVPLGIALLPGIEFQTWAGLSLAFALLSIIIGLLARREVRRSGGAVRGSWLAFFGIFISTVFVALCCLMPFTSFAPEAARRAQRTNHFKMMGLAMHNYHDSFGRFPPAVVYSPEGRPLYSWRVVILPYIEQQPLYERFHLNEPWDSPHNLTLLEKRPGVYDPLRREIDRTMTLAQVFNGPGTAFENRGGEPPKTPEDASNFPDGTGKTLLVVEAAEPVAWSRPIDLPYSPVGQISPLGRAFERGGEVLGVVALFADGSTRFLKKSLAESTLRALITRNGGEPLTGSEY